MGDEIATTAEVAEAAHLAELYEVRVSAPGASPERHVERPPEGEPKALRGKSPARWAFERLALYIRNFEASLDADHEVAMGYVGGDVGTLRIEGMGYFDPDIITFHGTAPDGSRIQLIQHVSQLEVLLVAAPKPEAQAEPRRIGFALTRDREGESG